METPAGRITKLVAQKKNPERVSVYLDGAFAFGVHQDLVLEFALQAGRVLGVEEQARIQAADRVYVAKGKAFAYLAHKARTAEEVRRKLRRSDFEDEVVEPVIERLRVLGYLDDAAYAVDYVRGRFANKGYGPARIRNELRRRGVASHHIEAALERETDPEDVAEAARLLAEKRWTALARETDPQRRRKKLFDYLRRRGYSFDLVRRVVEEVSRDV